MHVSSPRALIVSFVIGLAFSVIVGSIYAWLADKILAYAIGSILFIVGLIVFVIGLLGALEPQDGWASDRKKRGRRSMAAQMARQRPEIQEATPAQLGVWGALVGLPLIGLAIVAFNVSAA
jgi:hypothetical protein